MQTVTRHYSRLFPGDFFDWAGDKDFRIPAPPSEIRADANRCRPDSGEETKTQLAESRLRALQEARYYRAELDRARAWRCPLCRALRWLRDRVA